MDLWGSMSTHPANAGGIRWRPRREWTSAPTARSVHSSSTPGSWASQAGCRPALVIELTGVRAAADCHNVYFVDVAARDGAPTHRAGRFSTFGLSGTPADEERDYVVDASAAIPALVADQLERSGTGRRGVAGPRQWWQQRRRRRHPDPPDHGAFTVDDDRLSGAVLTAPVVGPSGHRRVSPRLVALRDCRAGVGGAGGVGGRRGGGPAHDISAMPGMANMTGMPSIPPVGPPPARA